MTKERTEGGIELSVFKSSFHYMIAIESLFALSFFSDSLQLLSWSLA